MGSANKGTAIAPLSTIGTRFGNSVSIALMPPKPTSKLRLKWLATAENQGEKPDTEFQYRPHIVDTDIDCGPRFCGPRFRDSYCWISQIPFGLEKKGEKGSKRSEGRFCTKGGWTPFKTPVVGIPVVTPSLTYD